MLSPLTCFLRSWIGFNGRTYVWGCGNWERKANGGVYFVRPVILSVNAWRIWHWKQ